MKKKKIPVSTVERKKGKQTKKKFLYDSFGKTQK
jgi:hypothetical protein